MTRFGDQADAFFKLYPAASDAEAAASELTRVRDEMAWHMRTWAKLQGNHGKSKTWVFYFTRTPPGTTQGATHTAELAYVFNIPGRNWTDVDRKLADTMSSYWTNFAATGDPNGKDLPAWPAFKEKSSERTMLLGEKVEASTGLEPARVALFDGVYKKLMASR